MNRDSTGVPTLCRSCFAAAASASGRCPDCGSPRLARHPELLDLAIAHVDCDAFYAAIEKRDDPSLVDRPVIVGGGRRGVVSTACYVARTYGVRSAMPMFKALELCPDATVIRPDMAKYVRVARLVRTLMETLTPAVEPLSIDEAFLDLRGTETLHKASPAETLMRLQRRIESEIGITVSVGLSHNKFLAKIASDLDKPRGFSVLGRAETRSFLAACPVSIIWGVGAAMQRRLAADGIRTVGHLQALDAATLARRYGTMGLRLARLSQGEDARPVTPESQARSISSETTFETDLGRREDLVPILRHLAEKVAARMKAKQLAGYTVVLKLKTTDFRQRTRQQRLPAATNLADVIYRAGVLLLGPELDGTRFRLIGIGVTELGPPGGEFALDLGDPQSAKRMRAEQAMDDLRSRFGEDALKLGITFRPDRTGPRRQA
ncbi:DNA polymerase IV [Propylenella binzhouense]|uniref:DNA polymerase IV n=1 Tax=Propylenella binzhouense TaxID=2555902 RepID=A0A964WSC7_9HYPH|nr:DNA polymerase IV [Propylenella binzhouense]MYZ46670.1 DNA polymerase IV [Propylenella binzhouense]